MRRAALLTCLAVTLALAAPAAHAQMVKPRIIGGSTTTIEQYPWQVAVAFDPAKVSGNPFQRQFCGGSLVTQYIVLTAGHCVHRTDPDNNSDLDPDDVDVILGQTTLSTAPPSSEFNIQGVAKHVGYDSSYGPGSGVPSNDVGYLVLQTPYTATTPIDIAGPDESSLWDPASSEQITGWGATAESGPGSGGSDTLQQATVPMVTDSSCNTAYGAYFNSATMVCAGFPAGGVDTCYGDSGGPMQAAVGGGQYRLVGITSWGEGCAQPNFPGVYTRVADNTFRSTVASKVFDLETTFGLPHEDIIGGDDTDPPETSINSGPSGPTNDSTPTFGFSSDEVGSTFQCRIDLNAFADCSGPGATHTPAALTDGAHTFEVRATDAASNTDQTPASQGFTVDTQLPSDPTVSSTSHTVGVTSTDPTVDVTFSGATDSLSGVDGFSYQWSSSPSTVPDTTKDAEETATGTTSPSLADGSWYFHLRTRDNAGNWTSTVHLGPFVISTGTVDNDPPETSIDSGPSGPTNDSTPTFGFSSDEAGSTFECRFSGSFDPCSGPGDTHTPAAPLADGAYTFEVQATDLSNNTDNTPATRSFTVDTQAPSDPTVSSSSHSVGVASSDPTVDLAFSGAADSLSGVDGFSYEWDSSASTVPDTFKDGEETATGTTSPSLADGSHYFHLRTRDNAGNWSSTVHVGPFLIDTTPPNPPPGGAPDGTPPVGSVSAKLKRSGSVKLTLGCDEDCAATAGGVLIAGKRSFKLAQVKVDVGAGGAVTLKLAAKSGAARRAIRNLLEGGAAGKAKLNVILADRIGNSITEKIAAKLRR